VAGTGNAGYAGDRGLAKNSSLNAPNGVSIDGAGNLYIADTSNNVIRKVTASTGIITTVAGDGTAGFAGDGQLATAVGVELSGPVGITADAQANLYIADIDNQRIRRVDAVSGLISTAAGNGDPSGIGDGKGTYSGDGGPANAAGLSLPYAVAFDLFGNMLIPDSANNRIRAVRAINGAITPASTISTIAGTGHGGDATCPSGLATSEDLNTPSGIALDPASNLYIADTQDSCIRKVNLTTGNMSTIAINGAPALTPTNVLDQAQVYAPIGVAVDGLGNVYYADFYYMLVDEIQSNKAVLNFSNTAVLEGEQSAAYQTVSVENDGNATASLTSVTPDTNASLDPSTTCGPTFPLTFTQDQDCLVNAYFAPITTGNPLLANVFVAGNTVNDNNPAAPMDVVLVGNSSLFVISLTATPAPSSAFGTSVTFAATVASGKGTPTGSVVFTDSLNGGPTTTLSTITLAGGEAVYSTAALAVGVHVITATYGADITTATVTQTVYEPTKTGLTASPVSPSTVGTPVVFTANVTAPAGGGQTLAGTVTFTDDAITLSNNTVAVTTGSGSGTATFTATNLPQGTNNITAVFTPFNASQVYSSTGTLKQDVQGVATFTLTSSPNPSTYGSAVAFAVAVPTVGTVAATGNVKVTIVPSGQTTPVYNLTVPLAGSPATGTASISTLPVGTYTATSSYAGDSNYTSTTAILATPQVVNGVATTTAAVATPNPAIAGKPVAINATVTPASGTVAPTGTVAFADTFNGTTTPLGGGAITLAKTGTASINPTLAVGTHSMLITYSGDLDDAASSFTLSLVVSSASTTVSVTASPSPAIVGATITFAATVSGNGGTPTGTVAFSATSGSTTVNLGTGTLDGSGKTSVTNAALGAGTYQVNATYSADANNATGTPGTTSLTVGTIPTVTSLTTATTAGNSPQTILVSTVANNNVAGPMPTGTVIFKNGSTTVGQATLGGGGAATLTPNLGAGSYSIIAFYGGDSLHGISQSSAIAITSTGSSYTIAIAPNAVSMATTQNAVVTVTLASVSGFSDTIGLGCASMPLGVNCHFSKAEVPLAANGTATAQLTIDTNNPLGGGATAMNQPSSRHTMEMAGLFLPFSLMLGWFVWRFRKRNSSVWSVAIILALSGAAFMATGCVGFTQSSAAAGTYTLQVVGVGVNSNVPAYQTVTLTITK
jgi:hypothetical protein